MAKQLDNLPQVMRDAMDRALLWLGIDASWINDVGVDLGYEDGGTHYANYSFELVTPEVISTGPGGETHVIGGGRRLHKTALILFKATNRVWFSNAIVPQTSAMFNMELNQ